MEALWAELLQWWRDHPVRDRYRALKISMWTKPDDPHGNFPKLKGKAIEVRSLVQALAGIWGNHMNPALPEHLAVLQGLKSSALMDEVLDSFPDSDVLPPDALKEFVDASWDYAKFQNGLADFYNKTHAYWIFDVTIKTHWTLHCAMEAPFLNPRLSWNFAGEDFMMKCRELHQSCCKGNSPAQSITKFATKYSHAVQQIFQQYENGTRM
tara:strand:+ start:626 stop:1255 length:630 start_codon:yes stop_codon:yes gene_type:complete